MQITKLNNGIEMPMLGFGVYQIPSYKTKECVLSAFEAGYRLIDTAQNYGNEAAVGDAIKSSDLLRDEIFITTKVMSNRNVAQSIDGSLRNLKTDYIDLLLVHWVMGNDLQTYRVLEDYCKQRKVRAIGLSNFYGKSLDNILRNCEITPAIIQQETHIYHQNKELRPTLEKHGICLQAWSPFGEGRANMFMNPVLVSIAGKCSKTTAQIILRFLLQSNIAAIPKTTHKNRMDENISIFDFSLTPEDMRKIQALDKGESLFGWFNEN